jgi:hypothetical protein
LAQSQQVYLVEELTFFLQLHQLITLSLQEAVVHHQAEPAQVVIVNQVCQLLVELPIQ